MPRVVIENLTKIFPGPRGERIHAVNNASLTVENGELLVLAGPSGCGKTTTLRLIAGLEEATQGTLSIDGKIMNGVHPKDRDIAMVFQNYALYPHMSVYENMAFGLKIRKHPRGQIDERVKEAASMLGLTDCLERKPEAISGGQRQRVALGRAIVRRPKIFLLDEPLANLDAPMRAQMRIEISRLHHRLAATMIYVTHDQVEAMTLGDRLAVMKDGAIQQIAEPMNVYRHPANLFVAGFIGSPPMNFFQGTLLRKSDTLFFQEQKDSAAAGAQSIRLRVEEELASRLGGYVDRDIILGIRPEAIELCEPGGPAERTLEGLVELVEPMGPQTYLHVAGSGRSFVARVPPSRHVRAGEKVSLVFDLRQAHFFDPETGQEIAQA